MSRQNLLSNKNFWLIILVIALLVILVAGLAPGTAHALTPTPTWTPTRTPTPTAPCLPATPEPLRVEPVTSPTGQLSQVVTVAIGNGDAVTVTAESGVFVVTGSFSMVNPALVTVSLLPNTTHNLTVAGHVKKMGCYGGYTLTTTRDKNGAPLVIVQQSSNLPDLRFTSVSVGQSPGCQPGQYVHLNFTVTNSGNAAAGPFVVDADGNTVSISGLAPGASYTTAYPGITDFYRADNLYTFIADAQSQVAESNEVDNKSYASLPPNPTCTPTRTRTPTPTSTGPTPTPTQTNTPTRTPTPTWTNTPGTPTATPTRTPTPSSGDLCASPTVITGGGSYAIPASGVCFRYVNATFVRGAMWSVMNGSDSTVSNVVKWYGGRNESVTNCINDSQTLNGNGAQINNFTVAKDSANAMYVTITTNKANTVSMRIQNWQNGTGCSVQPTPRP